MIMRNASEIMFDIAAENGFCVTAGTREYRGSQDSKFLDVEKPRLQSVIPMYSMFDQCDDDYEPDKDFVDQPYT